MTSNDNGGFTFEEDKARVHYTAYAHGLVQRIEGGLENIARLDGFSEDVSPISGKSLVALIDDEGRAELRRIAHRCAESLRKQLIEETRALVRLLETKGESARSSGT